MDAKGYAGKQLRVDLNEKKVNAENINSKIIRDFLGGVGYAAKILYDELGAKINSLGAKNKIIFATGPLTNEKIPGGGSIEVCFKSPLTGAWGEARCGGEFGINLRKAGYDFLIIEGKAVEPSYLVIDNNDVKIRSAKHLQGKLISEKINIIEKELIDDNFSLMVIGPAGENLVRFSTIMQKGRAVGRCGAGAVMGSKNLLAIAVRGTGKISIANLEKFREEIRKAYKIVRPHAQGFKEHGTTGDIPGCDSKGDWPTKNWQSNSWGKGDKLYEYFYKNNLVGNESCYKGCPLACGRRTKVKRGNYQTPEHVGGEYESISAFTAFILNEDMDAAVYSTYLCNEYGIDTISTGAVIAFAMECYEKGIITQEDCDNLKITWGNAEILPTMVKKIALRDGIGKILSNGVKKASKIFGKGTKEWAIHCKGLEGPAHDPRAGKIMAIAYGTANRGMCHIHPFEGTSYDCGKRDFGMIKYGVPDPNTIDRCAEKGKAKIAKILQDGCIIPDILGVCKFPMYVGLSLDNYASILSAVNDWQIDGEKLLEVGERVINLQRLFNIREGFNKKDDEIPERVGKKPLFGEYKGKAECVIKDYGLMLREYYKERGWDVDTGVPKETKLKELGILK